MLDSTVFPKKGTWSENTSYHTYHTIHLKPETGETWQWLAWRVWRCWIHNPGRVVWPCECLPSWLHKTSLANLFMTCQKAYANDPRHDQTFVKCIPDISRMHQVGSHFPALSLCSILIYFATGTAHCTALGAPIAFATRSHHFWSLRMRCLKSRKSKNKKNQLQQNHEEKGREQRYHSGSLWNLMIYIELPALPHLDKWWSSYCLAEMINDGKVCLNMGDQCFLFCGMIESSCTQSNHLQ